MSFPMGLKLLGSHNLPTSINGKRNWPWNVVMLPLTPNIQDSASWPKISIVTPSFNQAQFLEETIRSVLLQSYPNLEYIIIDGGSTDGSVEIIKKYEPWLTYWVSEPDRGQTYAIDKGMRHVSGSIVNWLNSDDYLLPDALFAVATAYKNSAKDACVLCCNANIVNEHGEILQKSDVKPTTLDEMICPTHLPLSGGIQASWFISSEAWKRVNGIDLGLNYAMDTDLYIRMHMAGIDFIPVNFTAAVYRTHSMTKTINGWKRNIAYKRSFYKKQISGLPQNEQVKYWKRIRKMFYSFCLRSITDQDTFFTRAHKILSAIHEYPEAILSRYQMMRCIHLIIRFK